MKHLKILLTSLLVLMASTASVVAHVGTSALHSHAGESNSVAYVIAIVVAVGLLYVTYLSSTKTKQPQKVRITQRNDFKRKN